MNYLWGGMLIIGIVYGVFSGNVQQITDAVLESSKEAVALGISMLGIVAFWTGLMEVAGEAGVIAGMTKAIAPFMRFLFPKIPKGHRAFDSLSANFVANILGLGWAATPAGLKAMGDLEELERERGNGEYMEADDAGVFDLQKNGGWKKSRGDGLKNDDAGSGTALSAAGDIKNVRSRTASDEMCTFLVMNISSLQLIPVNIIAYRSQYGSVNPTAVIAPAIAATAVSTGVAVVWCKIMGKKQRV